jgi:hypothetical protein
VLLHRHRVTPSIASAGRNNSTAALTEGSANPFCP